MPSPGSEAKIHPHRTANGPTRFFAPPDTIYKTAGIYPLPALDESIQEQLKPRQNNGGSVFLCTLPFINLHATAFPPPGKISAKRDMQAHLCPYVLVNGQKHNQQQKICPQTFWGTRSRDIAAGPFVHQRNEPRKRLNQSHSYGNGCFGLFAASVFPIR